MCCLVFPCCGCNRRFLVEDVVIRFLAVCHFFARVFIRAFPSLPAIIHILRAPSSRMRGRAYDKREVSARQMHVLFVLCFLPRTFYLHGISRFWFLLAFQKSKIRPSCGVDRCVHEVLRILCGRTLIRSWLCLAKGSEDATRDPSVRDFLFCFVRLLDA